MAGRKRLELNGYENAFIRVIREAVGDEIPQWAGKQVYWIVECKSCGVRKPRKSSQIKYADSCARCRISRFNADRDFVLEQKAKYAWPLLLKAVEEKDLDAIEDAVHVLKWYKQRITENEDVATNSKRCSR